MNTHTSTAQSEASGCSLSLKQKLGITTSTIISIVAITLAVVFLSGGGNGLRGSDSKLPQAAIMSSDITIGTIATMPTPSNVAISNPSDIEVATTTSAEIVTTTSKVATTTSTEVATTSEEVAPHTDVAIPTLTEVAAYTSTTPPTLVKPAVCDKRYAKICSGYELSQGKCANQFGFCGSGPQFCNTSTSWSGDCALYYGTDIIRPYPDSLTSSAPFPFYPGGFSTVGASDPFNLGCQNPGQIALTFDDGPGTPTIAILDILKANDVTAAFFILGRNINGYTQPDGFFQEGHPALIERMIAEGHIVADHSYDHKDMLSVPTSVLASQISATDAATTRVVGKSMKFFRFPYFSYNKSKLDYLTKTLKKIVVFANLDTKDYQDPNWLSTWDSILSSSDPRLASFIALNHDLYAQTATNLQGAIDIAKQRGYRFVSLEECLGWNAYD